ncbi:MAG TPA: adenylate kinase [Thermodesulfobacteriota bacterium]|jgi:adenylate kinase
MVLIIFGPPGAGKGTQASMITKNYDMLHISTGDMLRAAVKEGAELGNLAKSYMDKGELVPDDVVIGVIREVIKNTNSVNGYLLDGFPRTIPQAEALDRMLNSESLKVDKVVSIEVPDGEIISRIGGRRVCEKCGVMYHKLYDPPKNADVCDKCGGSLYQRDDDREDVIRKRLEVYSRQTLPLKTYYRDASILREIDGLGTIDDVRRRISDSLNQRT